MEIIGVKIFVRCFTVRTIPYFYVRFNTWLRIPIEFLVAAAGALGMAQKTVSEVMVALETACTLSPKECTMPAVSCKGGS